MMTSAVSLLRHSRASFENALDNHEPQWALRRQQSRGIQGNVRPAAFSFDTYSCRAELTVCFAAVCTTNSRRVG